MAEIRAITGRRTEGFCAAEKWYRILADDNAEPKQWLEAACRIVQPVDVEVRGGWTSVPNRKPGEIPPIRGESLRSKKNPSVADLMAKRVPQIASADTRTSNEMFFANDATDVAMALSKWDAKAAIPVLRRNSGSWRMSSRAGVGAVRGKCSLETMPGCFRRCRTRESPAPTMITPPGFARFPATDMFMPDTIKLFQPLWQKSTDPDIAAAADWLFNDPTSPWHCLAKMKNVFGERLIASPLLGVAAFQKSLLTNLGDKSPLGEIWFQDGRISTSPGLGIGYSFAVNDDPLLPKIGEKRTVRVCDWYAWHLSGLEASPDFEAYWPQEKRDAVIKDAMVFVRDWADRFAWNDTQKALFDPPMGKVRMIFGYHHRPATQADVRSHTAIFSLAGAGEVRAVDLDPFPTEAKWTTLKRFPVVYQGYDEKAKAQKIIRGFDQEGWIWQAEERMEGGKWKRYYGFVGKHIVAKVPAEEIELVKPIRPAAPTRP